MKKRILCLLLAAAIMLPLFPANVNAASYKYGLFIKTSDITNAGTDSEVYAGFKFYNDSEISELCDLDGENDHERNDGRLYEFTKEMQAPWMINQLFVELKGSDDWHCNYVQMAFPKIGDTTLIYKYPIIEYNTWTKGEGKILKPVGSITARNIQNYQGLDAWNGTFYLGQNTGTNLSYSWDGKIFDQYGLYNVMQYDDAPDMNYSLSNSGVGTSWFSFTPASASQNASLSINQNKLYDAMRGVANAGHHGIGSLTMNINLAFSIYSTSRSSAHLVEVNNQLVKKGIFTFYRNCFQLGAANISNTPVYSPRADFKYLNRQYNEVTVTISPTSIHCAGITQAQKKDLVTNFQCTAALYLGNSTSNKLCDMTITKSNETLTFKGLVPMDKSGSMNDGVRLQLNNISSSYNGRAYLLESGEASESYYFSTYKVDTKAPTVRLTDVDGNNLSIQNSIKTYHDFYIISSETLYPQAGVDHNESNQRYLRYELYKKNGDTYGVSKEQITSYTGLGSMDFVEAPVNTSVMSEAKIRLKTASPSEGQYKLRIYGWDDADNGLNPEKNGVESFYEIENIYLDSQAPRVAVTETIQNQASDGTKRNDYTFAITDLQTSREHGSWARTYYCFVEDGQQLPPDPNSQTITQSTGEMDVTTGMWAFVEGGTDTTTAVLKVQKGESFDGILYYYTEDSSGNDSRTEHGGDYFSKEIEIYNYDTEDTLIAEPYTYPQNRYNITFDLTDSNYTTEYRWIGSDGSFMQGFCLYTGAQDVGSAQQTGSNGEIVTFNGSYTLEYKVTETRSNNWYTYSKDYVFDNGNPVIETIWLSGNTSLLQAQQLKLDINDISGVKSATYRIVNPDGTYITGCDETPITLTMTADNRKTVNETLTFSLSENGVYGLVISAFDENDFESTKNLTFGIRSEKPQVTALNHNLSVLVDGCGATADGEYTLTLDLTDPVKNAAYLTVAQDVRYCISANGTDYGGWITAAEVDKSPGTGSINYALTLEDPSPLTEGWNTIYIKTACVNAGNQDVPTSSVVSDAQLISVLYDNKPPVFDMPTHSTTNWTNEDVIVVIKASDAATGVCTLAAQHQNASIEISPYVDGQFILTVKENLNVDLVLSDSLKNQTFVPLRVTNIDKSPPQAEAIFESVPSGERVDGKVEITLIDQTDMQTSFALVKGPSGGYELTEDDYLAFNAARVTVEESQTQINEDGLKVKKYTLRLRGLDGVYTVGLKSTDLLGHSTEVLFAEHALSFTDAEPEIIIATCLPAITKSTTTATLKFNVPLVILPNPPLDLLSMSEAERENYLSGALLEVDDSFVTEYSLVCDSAETVALYVMDEAKRTAILTFTPDAAFVAGFDISAHIEKNGQTIPNGGFISFLPGDTISYIVNPSIQYEKQLFYIDTIEYSGMELNEQRSVAEAVYEGDDVVVPYISLCFDALHDGKTTKSVHFKSYTFEGNEEERMEEEYLAISVVDETTPNGSVTYSETNPTNQNVTATITMSDSESGITKLEKSYDGGVNYEDTSSITKYTEEFSENGTVHFRITNGAGMTSIIPVTVGNIDKTKITENTHYTVDYRFENYLGEWLPISPDKGYRSVMAVINPVPDSGKVLSATNNGGSFARILTAGDNKFTFNFCDEAGNTGYREVEYTLFDNNPGTTTWVLSNTEKTNRNIFATLTVTDESGEIAHVEVKKDGMIYPFVGEPIGDEYTVELDSSGAYQATAYDGAGNSWTEVISVSNIDKTTPQVLTKLYSTPIGAITTRSVRVELTEFNKEISTIRMTGVELVSGLTSQDIVYTPGEMGIRFKKNGSVAMMFIDEFGNEGFDVVTVSNICTDPPAVEAVAVLAADLLSVNVTFDKMLDQDGVPVDKYRELTDLMVTYQGITYQLATKIFTLKNNGDYEFIVHDSSGSSQKIILKVTGIDDLAPVITEIRWEYKYYVEDRNGVWEERTHSRTIEPGKDTSGTESGYRVAADTNPETNRNVDVTVTTNKETMFIGGKDEFSLEKAMEYRKNGLFNFNLEGRNGTSTMYGIDIEVIDKTPPVITLDNGPELIFIEGMSSEKDPMYAYDKAKLLDFHAYDIKDGIKIDLTHLVKIRYGIGERTFDPDNIDNNEFLRSNPYYVEYSVYDAAGNGTTVRRTIRLVGFYDTIALVNGKMPDSTNVVSIMGAQMQISLKNFGGIAYARYDKGIFTQGQMKTRGISLTQRNGLFTADGLTEGWYTVYIQTDKRDYFNIQVYVVPQNENSQGGSK